MTVTTMLLLAIGLAVALFVFREALPRIAAIAAVVLAALWFYQSRGGDLQAMWADAWAAGAAAAAWLTAIADSARPS